MHNRFMRLLHRRNPPELSNTEELVSYVDSEISDVIDYSGGDLPVFYLIRDLHMFTEKTNTRKIDKLISKLGLDLVGIEGYVEGTDSDKLNKDIVKRARRFKYYFDKKIDLVGLEDEELFRNSRTILDLMISYENTYSRVFRELSEAMEQAEIVSNHLILDRFKEKYAGSLPVRYGTNPDEMFAHEMSFLVSGLLTQRQISKKIEERFPGRLLEELDNELPALIGSLTIPHNLPDYREDDISPFKLYSETKFYQTLSNLLDRYTVLERSIKAVDIALSECKKRDKQQMAILFGEEHTEQMQDEVKGRGLTYITL